MTTEYGKIATVCFGYGGYQNGMLGLSLTFEGKGWGCGTFLGYWDYSISISPYTKWTEEDRAKYMSESVLAKISEMLADAKKEYLHELENVPVVVNFNSDGTLADWRIFTEVL